MSISVNGQTVTAQLNGVWETGLLTTNPAINAVIVDTGPLPAGDYFFQLMFESDANTRFLIELRNAANSATLDSQRVPLGADQFVQPIFGTKISIAEGERVRAIMVAALVGVVQASIIYSRIAG